VGFGLRRSAIAKVWVFVSDISSFNPWPTGQEFANLAFGHGLNLEKPQENRRDPSRGSVELWMCRSHVRIVLSEFSRKWHEHF
jgi:hypothetical protein